VLAVQTRGDGVVRVIRWLPNETLVDFGAIGAIGALGRRCS
jgi:hypothetical protein